MGKRKSNKTLRKNKEVDVRKFKYQLSKWMGDWMDLCGMIFQIDPEDELYGDAYIVKRNFYKRNCKWAIFTRGEFTEESGEYLHKDPKEGENNGTDYYHTYYERAFRSDL